MSNALGISIHTGWAACVVVRRSPTKREVLANRIVHVLTEPERFCFHRASEMPIEAAAGWLSELRARALKNARAELKGLLAHDVGIVAVIARAGEAGELSKIVSSHTRIHAAEGCFYRDLFIEACGVPAQLIAASELDVARAPKLPVKPWGKDQKLAALAAWRL